MIIIPIPTELSILDRISESDVVAWLAARLAQIRDAGLPVHCLDVGVNIHDDDWACSWSMHCAGECVVSEDTSQLACTHICAQLSAPEHRASAKRREAQRLIEEADALAIIARNIPAIQQSADPLLSERISPATPSGMAVDQPKQTTDTTEPNKPK